MSNIDWERWQILTRSISDNMASGGVIKTSGCGSWGWSVGSGFF